MKKALVVLAVLVILGGIISGCSDNSASSSFPSQSNRVTTAATAENPDGDQSFPSQSNRVTTTFARQTTTTTPPLPEWVKVAYVSVQEFSIDGWIVSMSNIRDVNLDNPNIRSGSRELWEATKKWGSVRDFPRGGGYSAVRDIYSISSYWAWWISGSHSNNAKDKAAELYKQYVKDVCNHQNRRCTETKSLQTDIEISVLPAYSPPQPPTVRLDKSQAKCWDTGLFEWRYPVVGNRPYRKMPKLPSWGEDRYYCVDTKVCDGQSRPSSTYCAKRGV